MEQLAEQLQDGPTSLISVMRVQNETGWIFPFPKSRSCVMSWRRACRYIAMPRRRFCKMPVDPREWGVQLLTAGAHKIGGPRGIGILYVRRGLPHAYHRVPAVTRSAVCVRVPSRCSLRWAWQKPCASRRRIWKRTWNTPQAFARARHRGLEARNPRCGGACAGRRKPHILSISVPGLPNAVSVKYLSGRRVCVSRASACEESHTTVAPGTWRPKHPLSLQAAGIPLREGKETLRVSFFHRNTPEDVDRFVAVLAQCARERCASRGNMELRGGANREQAFAVASSGALARPMRLKILWRAVVRQRGAEEVLALRLCALTGEFYRANGIVLADAAVAVARLDAVARGYG